MKFSKSDRSLHSHNFNPPPNVYQPHAQPTKLLTGSLAGPSLLSRNTFGYQLRFDNKISEIPGPGSYLQQKSSSVHKSSGDKIMKGNYYPPSQAPSIPYNYYGQDVDEEEENYVRELALSENVMRSVKAMKHKEPAFSFGKSDKTHSYLPSKVAEREREIKE